MSDQPKKKSEAAKKRPLNKVKWTKEIAPEIPTPVKRKTPRPIDPDSPTRKKK